MCLFDFNESVYGQKHISKGDRLLSINSTSYFCDLLVGKERCLSSQISYATWWSSFVVAVRIGKYVAFIRREFKLVFLKDNARLKIAERSIK